MATITTSEPEFYQDGTSGASAAIGYADNVNRVARYSFSTPADGASKIDISGLRVSKGDGAYASVGFGFFVTDDANSYANAGEGSSYHGKLTFAVENGVCYGKGSVSGLNLLPNTTYYIWVFPLSKKYGWWYGARQGFTVKTEQLGNSTIKATDANIGAVSMVTVSRKNSGYTHSIAVEFQGATGFLDADGEITEAETKITATSIPFSIPENWYSLMGSARTAVCTLTCRTYSGDNLVGTAQKTQFNVTASETASAPTVTGSVEDSNESTIAVTGNKNTLVRYMSTALCTITATAKNGATITQKTIDGKTVSGNTATISGIQRDEVVFAAVDSRGYSASQAVRVTLIPYVRLTCNLLMSVPSAEGSVSVTIKGNYFSGSFGAVSNTLTVQYRYKEAGGSYCDWKTLNVSISGTVYSVTGTVENLDYRKVYTFQARAQDKLDSAVSVEYPVKTRPDFNWGGDTFNFNSKVHFSENDVEDASGMVRKMSDGIWIGDSKDRNSTEISQGTGIFVDTKNNVIRQYINGVGELLMAAMLANCVRTEPVSVPSFDSIDDALNIENGKLEDHSFGFLCFDVGGVMWHCILFKTNDNYATAEFYGYNGRKRKALIGGTWGALTAENADKFQPMAQEAYEALTASGKDDPTAFYLIVEG